jgi:hypothetical protein
MSRHARLAAVSLCLTLAPTAARAVPPSGPRARTIESLSPEQARRLVDETQGPNLVLPGLTALDADTARALAEYKGNVLLLNGLKRLDAAAAQALGTYEGGHLYLNGLTAIDADTARALAAAPRVLLAVDGLVGLDPHTARLLAGFKGVRLTLNGLESLDADTARALAAYEGEELHLNGLKKLGDDVAEALAACGCRGITLGGLATIDELAADRLAEYRKGWLSLPRVMAALGRGVPLTPATARLVCGCANGPERAVELGNVVALDAREAVEIAGILATAKGSLSLPQLKKISPKALTALARKENLLIPPIERLEFIAEPDGSPTEDFVIPEGFESRQKKLVLPAPRGHPQQPAE